MVRTLIWHQSIIFDTSNKSHKSQIVTLLVSFHCLSITCQKWWEKKEITAACFESCVLLQCCSTAAVLSFFLCSPIPFDKWLTAFHCSLIKLDKWLTAETSKLKLLGKNHTLTQKIMAKFWMAGLSALIVRIQSWGRPWGWQFYKEKRCSKF